MKNISILVLLLLTSCSSINFARDEGLVRRDEVSEMDDHSEAIPVQSK
jgi:hypothetical protein